MDGVGINELMTLWDFGVAPGKEGRPILEDPAWGIPRGRVMS
jgi:hypothetical protein